MEDAAVVGAGDKKGGQPQANPKKNVAPPKQGGKGRNRGGNKNQKTRNVRPKTQKTPAPDKSTGDAQPSASNVRATNKDNAQDRRNNGRRRGDGGKFGRRLRPQQRASGRKSSESSPAVHAKTPSHGEESSQSQPPHLKLGPSAPVASVPWQHRQNQQNQQPYRGGSGGGGGGGGRAPQTWGPTPEGLTDLSRNKYSVPWLLQRRDNRKVQDCTFELPDELSLSKLSPTSRARRYPFVNTRRHYQQQGRSNTQQGRPSKEPEEAEPAWMNDEDCEKDFNFKVLDGADREHFKKFGTVKNESDVKVISLQEYEEKQRSLEEKAQEEEYQKPVTHDDIMNAFTTEKGGDEDFNPDNMFSADPQPAAAEPAKKPPVSVESDNFLESFMKAPNPKGPVPDLGPPHRAAPNSAPGDRAMKPPSSAAPGAPTSVAPGSTAPTASRAMNPNTQPGATDQPADPRRPNPTSRSLISSSGPYTHSGLQAEAMQQSYSNNDRTINRTNKLRANVKEMSVHPSQLAYASRSATRAMRGTLEGLGYRIVPQKKPDEAGSAAESEEIRSHEQIKKMYEDAITRANKIFYSHQHIARMQQMQTHPHRRAVAKDARQIPSALAKARVK